MECMLGSAMYLKSTGMSLEEAERAEGSLIGEPTATESERSCARKQATQSGLFSLWGASKLRRKKENQTHHQDHHYDYGL